MSWVLSSRATEEKNTAPFSSTRCQDRLSSKYWSPYLRLLTPLWSSFKHQSFCLRTLSWNWPCWLQSLGLTRRSWLCSENCEGLRWQVAVYRGKMKSTIFAEKRNPCHASSFEPSPARLEDSRDSLQGPREKRSTTDLTHASIFPLQDLALVVTVPNILSNEVQSQNLQKNSGISKRTFPGDYQERPVTRSFQTQIWADPTIARKSSV